MGNRHAGIMVVRSSSSSVRFLQSVASLFFAGYSKGAHSRAIGFTLAFYPALGMLLACTVIALVWGLLD